jgi:hypothetical protein
MHARSAETLMQPSRSSMTKELARLARDALGAERSGSERIYNEVVRLCAARGAAAHAGREPARADMEDSYRLVRKLIVHSPEVEANDMPVLPYK